MGAKGYSGWAIACRGKIAKDSAAPSRRLAVLRYLSGQLIRPEKCTLETLRELGCDVVRVEVRELPGEVGGG